MAGNKRPFMPFYGDDFFDGTLHMTIYQRDMYLRFLWYAWKHDGELPADRKILRKIALDEDNQGRAFDKNLPFVLQKFTLEGGNSYRHRRVDEELARVKDVSENRRNASFKRWNRNANADANGMQMHSKSNPTHTHIQKESFLNGDRKEVEPVVWIEETDERFGPLSRSQKGAKAFNGPDGTRGHFFRASAVNGLTSTADPVQSSQGKPLRRHRGVSAR
jgi:uncharacterized protein YdaU (DUF1376 family)